MQLIRAIVLGIVVTLSLLGGTATVANATPHTNNAADDGNNDLSGQTDPGDPGLPPDE